jgi:hypothetical protein
MCRCLCYYDFIVTRPVLVKWSLLCDAQMPWINCTKYREEVNLLRLLQTTAGKANTIGPVGSAAEAEHSSSRFNPMDSGLEYFGSRSSSHFQGNKNGGYRHWLPHDMERLRRALPNFNSETFSWLLLHSFVFSSYRFITCIIVIIVAESISKINFN